MIPASATVTQKAWLEISRSKIVCSLMPTMSWMATPLISGRGALVPAAAPSGGMDRSRDQPGDLFRARFGDRLLRHLAPAAEHEDAVGDRKDVRHAMADKHDGDTLVAEAADQIEDF